MIQKLALVIILVVVAWIVLTWIQRKAERRGAEQVMRQGARRRGRSGEGGKIEDMVNCPRCGNYQAESAIRNCGRDDCPYPR